MLKELLYEILQEKNSVKFIEWSENIAPLLPEKTI